LARSNATRIAGMKVDLSLGIADFNRGVNEATRAVRGMQRDFNQAAGNISQIFKGALAGIATGFAVGQIGNLVSAIDELADKGEIASSIADNFESLGGKASQIDKAKESTLGLIDSFDLMAIANKGLAANVKDFGDNFGQVAELAARFADAMGTDTKVELENITQALITGKAKGLIPYGFELTGLKGRAEITAAAMKQLPSVISKFSDATDSASNAHAAFKVSLEEANKEMGAAINDSDELRQSWRDMQTAIEDIDWKDIGEGLAGLRSTILDIASVALPWLIRNLNESIKGFQLIADQGIESQITNIAEEIKQLDDLQTVHVGGPFAGLLGMGSDVKIKIPEVDKQLEAKWKELNKLTLQLNKSLTDQVAPIKKSESALHGLGNGASDAADEVEKLRQKWAQFASNSDIKSLGDQLKKAADSLDLSGVDALEKQLRDSVQNDFLREWDEAIKKGAVTYEEVMGKAEEEIQKQRDDTSDRMTKAAADHGREMEQALSKATDSFFAGMQTAFDAIDPQLGDMFSGLSQLLSDETKQGLTEGIASALGTDAGSVGGYAQAGGMVIGDVLNAESTDRNNKDNSGTGRAVGAGVGAVAGAVVGSLIPVVGTAIGAVIGAYLGGVIGEFAGGFLKWGPQNPETQARHAFANFIEEGFQKLGQVSFFDAAGVLKNQRGSAINFLEGSTDRFNAPNWTDGMSEWGDTAKTTFLGLGEAMEEVLNISEDVGAQMGFILGENLLGNIDNARLWVQQLGLSFQEMEDGLVAAGRAGEMRWHEVEVSIQGAAEAFKPGLEAVGAVKGAVDELVESGGRGVAALKSVKDIAQETLEAGGHTLEDMRNIMSSQGVDQALADSIMQSIAQRGISTLEGLLAANDRTVGGIVADIESLNKGVAEQWAQMTKDLENIGEKIADLPTEKDIKVRVKTEIDANTADLFAAQENNFGAGGAASSSSVEAFASGGVVGRATLFNNSGSLGLMGEAGPEAIMPLRWKNGRLGVDASGLSGRGAGGVVIHVDARGADHGVENRILEAMSIMQEQLSREFAMQ
jgi:hypothetical protein